MTILLFFTVYHIRNSKQNRHPHQLTDVKSFLLNAFQVTTDSIQNSRSYVLEDIFCSYCRKWRSICPVADNLELDLEISGDFTDDEDMLTDLRTDRIRFMRINNSQESQRY